MSGDHNIYCASNTKTREVRIHLIDDYSGQDILVIDKIGEEISHLHESFRTFALAAGFHPDAVKEYFEVSE